MASDDLKTKAELYDPYILVCDNHFTEPKELIPALLLAAEAGRSCLIICNGIEGNALGLIMKNKLEGGMDIVCVTAPLYGEGRKWRMEDLAVQVGGAYFTDELGYDIRRVKEDMFGTAAYVRVTESQTIITGAGGKQDEINRQIQKIRYLAEHTDYAFNQKRYQERLARFVSGIAYIDVGGRTEPELWERKMRAEDAVHAARAAYESGIVPGGGIALLNLVPALTALAETFSDDEKLGILIVAKAVTAPARQMIENAGQNGSMITASLLEREAGIAKTKEQSEKGEGKKK